MAKEHKCGTKGTKEELKSKCNCSSDCTCGCQEGKECTCEGNCKCGCESGECSCDCKCGCENGECSCDCNKNRELKEIKETFEKREKEIFELNAKVNQILATASYYKNEAENVKKDFERFKERNKNIESEYKTKANEDVAKKLLPILDNFDQAVSHVDESVMKGFEMIYHSLIEMLADLGVEEIEAEGELNPEFHNCITTESCEDDQLDGKIASVYQKGYKFKETNKVVRPASVSVYKK